ncbi:hypothetical protein V5279_23620 [Bradyrhizobium sp. 26S5]|uniref:hypothetical protein n=1 Tax=Bradyrhizobium sp. 26S5 TaxID=3139729 RepID=UPI0030CA65CC
MKTFWLSANLEGASLQTLVKSDMIDDLVSGWNEAAEKVSEKNGDPDLRGVTKDFIISALKKGAHRTDQDVGYLVAQALLWFAVKGEMGERLLPFMREGGPNMKVHTDITCLEGNFYNFRTTADEKTSAAMTPLGLV